MKRLIIATMLVIAAGAWPVAAQTTTVPTRPVSAVITQVITSATGVTSVSGAWGQALNATYLYVASNGVASAGLGNTVDQLRRGKLTAVVTESVLTPPLVKSNGVVNINGEITVSQLPTATVDHLGLGGGLNTLWHVGWLQKLHFGPLQNLQGITLAATAQPDIDKAAHLKFGEKETIADFKAGVLLTF